MPTTTSHWSWPSFTRSASDYGSGSALHSAARVLRRSLLGAIAQEHRLAVPKDLMIWPSEIGVRSMSIGIAAAIVAPSGFI